MSSSTADRSATLDSTLGTSGGKPKEDKGIRLRSQEVAERHNFLAKDIMAFDKSQAEGPERGAI